VKIGIVLFPLVEELDFVGPMEMFGMWGLVGGVGSVTLVAEKPGALRCAKGLDVLPQTTFADCPPLDALLVPGGQGTRTEIDNPALIDFIRNEAKTVKHVLSVCTGSFLLHRAGLLQGRRATTHWASLDRLRALGDVKVVEERFVRDGIIWSSAGVSAGTDMALAFIDHVEGSAMAGKVQLAAEYFPDGQRYGGSDQHERAPRYAREAVRMVAPAKERP
jgi:transcriptional regulator GlxA family with amidase domain